MKLPWRNSDSEMFMNLNIDSFEEMLKIFTFGFKSRVSVSNNLFIAGIYTHPVLCIQTFGPGGIMYYTLTALIYSMHTLISMPNGFISQ